MLKNLSRYLILPIVIALAAISSQRLLAQGVSFGANGVELQGFGDVDLDKTADLWGEEYKNDIAPKMNLLVARIIDICDLDERDAKKLSIAVKGVVSKRISAGREQVRQFARKSGLVKEEAPESLDALDDLESAEDKRQRLGEPQTDLLNFYGASRRPNGVVGLKSYFQTPIVEHSLWTTTLKKTLSVEQQKRYHEHLIKTHQRIMDLAVDTWVLDLDLEVSLSDEQASQIVQEIVEQIKADQLVTVRGPTTIRKATILINKEFADAQSLGKFLNENQTARREFLARPVAGGGGVGWGSPPNR